MKVDCLLLAGGSSKRMGEPKMLLEMEGETLFEYVLKNHLRSSARRICAVVPGWIEGFGPVIERHAHERVDFVSMPGECEMSASLKAGWKRVAEREPDAVMISLADKALVTPGLIDAVIGGYMEAGMSIGVPVFKGARGHPVILSAELGDEVYGLTGDRGARDIVEEHEDDVAEVPVDTDGILVDIDTRDDFRELERRLREIG